VNHHFKTFSVKTYMIILVVILSFLSYQETRAEIKITRNSVTSGGTQGDNDSEYASISPDGRFVAFTSTASNLVSGDTNGVADIFVKDRETGAIVRANTTSSGGQVTCSLGAGSFLSGWGSDSNTGSFDGYLRVVFTSCLNLVGQTNDAYTHVFVKVLDPSSLSSSSSIVLVDENRAGEVANNGAVLPKISGNGRYVTFATGASNLVYTEVNSVRTYLDTNGQSDVYLRDLNYSLLADKVVGVSVVGTTFQSATAPCINRTGSRVAFQTTAAIAGSSDTNSTWDFYLSQSSGLSLLSVSTGGTAGNAQSKGDYATGNHPCDFSADGRYFVFPSEATNLVSTSLGGTYANVFLRDLTGGTTYWISKKNDGTQFTGSCYFPTVSDNGRFISFYNSAASYVYDREKGVLRWIHNEILNVGGNSEPEMSKNGRYIVFDSFDSSLVLSDSNSKGDVFTYDILNKAHQDKGDFDVDGATDVAYFHPSTGYWYSLSVSSYQFGASGDIPTPGDYDGDGKTDYAVFRPSDGYWYILPSTTSTLVSTSFGASGDKPVAADYDGDEVTDIAVWRVTSGNGYWYLLKSTDGYTSEQFGTSGDKPVPGDYDKDGKADIAVFRPSDGYWYLSRSTAGFTGIQFGNSSDTPVQSDYDGDGQTDLAVFRTVNGDWYWKRIGSSTYTSSDFGAATDKPTPGDYDNDGLADFAVFRPSTGAWYISRTSSVVTDEPTLSPTADSSDIPIPYSNVP
jgi:hypothetical protein